MASGKVHQNLPGLLNLWYFTNRKSPGNTGVVKQELWEKSGLSPEPFLLIIDGIQDPGTWALSSTAASAGLGPSD